MEYNYAITTYYDGELFHTARINDLFTAVETWQKCSDVGDAKEYATYNFVDLTGKMYTKTFYRNGEVTIK
jgi:hypothetical protein